MRRGRRPAQLGWGLLLLLQACLAAVSRYDPVSYATFTALKAEVATLVETFDSTAAAANAAEIARVRLALRKATEYEKGKGPPNQESVEQLAKVTMLFDNTTAAYRRGDALGSRFYREQARLLEQAFDIVIATEQARNPRREEDEP
jgi:hypothetical protein